MFHQNSQEIHFGSHFYVSPSQYCASNGIYMCSLEGRVSLELGHTNVGKARYSMNAKERHLELLARIKYAREIKKDNSLLDRFHECGIL